MTGVQTCALPICEYGATSEAITKNAITAIILLILRSFQRKGLCDSGLKAKSTTFVRNITTIRLRSQFVILKMNINMTDITERQKMANWSRIVTSWLS